MTRSSTAWLAGTCAVAGLLAAAALAVPAAAQAPAPPARAQGDAVVAGGIEGLLRDGWEVTGFVAASDIRTLVLLRHKTNPWLVQCSVLIDITRQPRPIIRCYELR